MNSSPYIRLALGAFLSLAGCETVTTETSDGRPMPPRARVPQSAPDGVAINAMSVLYAPKPTDSDATVAPIGSVLSSTSLRGRTQHPFGARAL